MRNTAPLSRPAAFATIAAKEFRDCARGRWLAIGAALFAVLTLAIVFGTAAAGGGMSFRGLGATINSLASLTVFLLPLLSILVGYDAFVGEEEAGTLLLMLTYPVRRTDFLLGKLAGESAAILAAAALGFLPLLALSLAGVVPYGAPDLAGRLLDIAWSGWLLALVSLTAAHAVSLVAASRARALGALLLVWLLVVLLYDLALLVLAAASSDSVGQTALKAMLLANPASVFRLLNQGLIGLADPILPTWALALSMAAWAALLELLSAILLSRKTP